MNRRATLMLAIASVVGAATPLRRARAESDTLDEVGQLSSPKRDQAGGISNPRAASQFRDLKTVGPQGQVTTIHHRRGTFEVTTADGRGTVFREADLRFKIDTSDHGPLAGKPVILPGGMQGDRASVFFASPSEIGTLIKHRVDT